ncbi:MAG: DUF2281 domain-containing protein [Phormidesmis sp.]
MEPSFPVERRLIEAIRTLAPEKQQAVLDFAEFLQHRQNADGINDETIVPSPFFGEEASDSGYIDGAAVDLASRGINAAQANELKFRLQAFAEDWNRSEATVYDDL